MSVLVGMLKYFARKLNFVVYVTTVFCRWAEFTVKYQSGRLKIKLTSNHKIFVSSPHFQKITVSLLYKVWCSFLSMKNWIHTSNPFIHVQ